MVVVVVVDVVVVEVVDVDDDDEEEEGVIGVAPFGRAILSAFPPTCIVF